MRDLGDVTTNELREALGGEEHVVALVPVGTVEPHGPHLPLETDTIISRAVIERAGPRLEEEGLESFVTPAVEFGVTECGASFAGTISIGPETLTAYLSDIVESLLDDGFDHVSLVNNHLEPEHDRAVRRSIESFDASKASVATPLAKRWARTLSEEFKRGECHAGKYETSLLLAAAPDRVDTARLDTLPEIPVSLSEKLREGVSEFAEMGLADAYAGAPAEATAEHGDEMLDRLAEMVLGEILESRDGGATPRGSE